MPKIVLTSEAGERLEMNNSTPALHPAPHPLPATSSRFAAVPPVFGAAEYITM